MESLKHRWRNTPSTIRKPLVLIVGMIFVIAAPFTGVLPGPGGIPVFLVGVAILATEYAWAQRLRDRSLHHVRQAGQAWREHKTIGTVLIVLTIVMVTVLSVIGYRYVRSFIVV